MWQIFYYFHSTSEKVETVKVKLFLTRKHLINGRAGVPTALTHLRGQTAASKGQHHDSWSKLLYSGQL